MIVLSGQPVLKEMGGLNFIPSDLTDVCNFPFACQCMACGVKLTLQPFGVVTSVCLWLGYIFIITMFLVSD